MIRHEAQSARIQLLPVPADRASANGAARSSASSDSLAAEKSAFLDQAYEEYCRRVEGGEAVDADEFCERFSAFKTSLRKLIVSHRYLEENPHLYEQVQARQWPRPGEAFLGFQLIEELGRGAFARVFLAREAALGDRWVALKLSPSRGRAEAETLGRLAHPHIVPVHSVHHDPRTRLAAICMPYVGRATLCDVMERVFGGKSLPQHARPILEAIEKTASDGPAPVAATEKPHVLLRRGSYVDGVLLLGRQLADALAFIHAQGIRHRDLKPSNILISPAGRPMLLDFNLCADERGNEERLGGTLPYMAPEQLRAMGSQDENTLIGPPADLFSFGVILYELLTGVHPFGPVLKGSVSRLPGTLLERQERGPRRLRELNPAVDARLARLVEQCLDLDAGRRPSAEQVGAELRKGLAATRRLRRWSATHVKTLLAAGLMLLVTAGAAGAWLATRPPYGERQLQAGWEQFDQGHYDEAARHFGNAGRDPTWKAAALVARGRTYLRLGDEHRTLALSDFQVADQLKPNDPAIKALIGCCESLSNQHDVALTLYDHAFKAGLVTPELLNNLGYSYERTNNYAKAQERLDHALRLNPDLWVARLNRAVLDYRRALPLEQPLATALEDIERAVQIGPPCPQLHLEAARIYAYATQQKPELLHAVFRQLARAIEQGQDPNELIRDDSFSALRSLPEFERLTKATPREKTHDLYRVLDPLGASR